VDLLKEEGGKKGPKTRQQLMTAIVEWCEKILLEYDLQKLIHSMKKKASTCSVSQRGTYYILKLLKF